MRTQWLRLNGTVERDPAIDAWMKKHRDELGAIAQQWFELMRQSGTKSANSCMTAVQLHV